MTKELIRLKQELCCRFLPQNSEIPPPRSSSNDQSKRLSSVLTSFSILDQIVVDSEGGLDVVTQLATFSLSSPYIRTSYHNTKMPSIFPRQNNLNNNDEFIVDDGGSFWWTRVRWIDSVSQSVSDSLQTGQIVRWSVFFGIFFLLLAYMLLGYWHAKRRINKGLAPLRYHRVRFLHSAKGEVRYLIRSLVVTQ